MPALLSSILLLLHKAALQSGALVGLLSYRTGSTLGRRQGAAAAYTCTETPWLIPVCMAWCMLLPHPSHTQTRTLSPPSSSSAASRPSLASCSSSERSSKSARKSASMLLLLLPPHCCYCSTYRQALQLPLLLLLCCGDRWEQGSARGVSTAVLGIARTPSLVVTGGCKPDQDGYCSSMQHKAPPWKGKEASGKRNSRSAAVFWSCLLGWRRSMILKQCCERAGVGWGRCGES